VNHSDRHLGPERATFRHAYEKRRYGRCVSTRLADAVPVGRRGVPAREVARGRASVVFDLGDGTVLRRCLDPGADVSGEAAVMAHARRHGVPTPRVLEASGPDLVMEHVAGPTMLSDLFACPQRAAQHGRLLAELHHALDCVPPLSSAPDDHRLLHLDLHPGNVLLSEAGPVVIDWTNAAAGPRPLDVATTWVVLACMGAVDSAVSLDVVRATVLNAFLEHIDQRAARSMLAQAAATRLSDRATADAERQRIGRLLAAEQ
jgi:aminoglycoside phosphotransferase (APT) family kinase protein